MNDTVDKVISPENQAFNCSQKVFSAFSMDYGIDSDLALRLSGALGGGLRIGETCGALVAALLVVGLKYGTADPLNLEAKALCDEKEHQISESFRQMHGSIACRDLLGIDTSIGNNRGKAKEMGLFNDICPNIIRHMIKLLKELGY